MRLKIQHTTRYRFEEPVRSALQQLRKTPKTAHQQTVLSWSTRVSNGKKELSFEDHHLNVTELISFGGGVTELEIASEGEVELEDTNGIVGRHRSRAPLWLYANQTPQTEAKSRVAQLIRGISDAEPLERLHALSSAIRDEVTYEVGVSQSDWSAEDALREGRGVCQDHAHVFLASARAMGFSARYISGYLMLNEQTAQEAMHAWAEAYIPDLGWVGFDVSNGISPDARYVRVATGLDYSEAAPISGTRIGGAGEALEVQIEVAQQ